MSSFLLFIIFLILIFINFFFWLHQSTLMLLTLIHRDVESFLLSHELHYWSSDKDINLLQPILWDSSLPHVIPQHIGFKLYVFDLIMYNVSTELITIIVQDFRKYVPTPIHFPFIRYDVSIQSSRLISWNLSNVGIWFPDIPWIPEEYWNNSSLTTYLLLSIVTLIHSIFNIYIYLLNNST